MWVSFPVKSSSGSGRGFDFSLETFVKTVILSLDIMQFSFTKVDFLVKDNVFKEASCCSVEAFGLTARDFTAKVRPKPVHSCQRGPNPHIL